MPANLSIPAARSTANFYTRLHRTMGQRHAADNLLPPTVGDFARWLEAFYPAGGEGRSVLDAGCGFNAFYARICRDRGFGRVCAVDINPDSVRRVAADIPGIAVSRGSVVDLPYADGAFDLAVCSGVAHHTPDPEKALSEVARVLKPGGTAYVSLYCFHRSPFELLVQCLRAAGRVLPIGVIHGVFRGVPAVNNFLLDHMYVPVLWLFTAGEVLEMLGRQGLQVVEHFPNSFDFFAAGRLRFMTGGGLVRVFVCHKPAGGS